MTDTNPRHEVNMVTASQDMPTFSIICMDSSDMPPLDDFHMPLSFENLWLQCTHTGLIRLRIPDLSIKLDDAKTKECTVDRREMARATGLEIEKHEAAKWRCSCEEKERAAVLAAAIIANHRDKTKESSKNRIV